MNVIDLKIIRLLLKNCRITYREIAESLDLSINSVYKRVQFMIDNKLILNFTAKPSNSYLKAINVLIYGKSDLQNLKDLIEIMGQNNSIYFIGLASNNFMIFDSFLQNISEMHSFTDQISSLCKLSNPLIGIKKLNYKITTEELQKLDYRILKLIQNDARLTYNEIGDHFDISAKTVKRRIERMMSEYLVDFSINFAPQLTGIIISDFHIYLDPNMDSNKEFNKLLQDFDDCILYIHQLSNIPKIIIMTCLVNSNISLIEKYQILQNRHYSKVEQIIIFYGKFFETWKDKIFKEKLAEL